MTPMRDSYDSNDENSNTHVRVPLVFIQNEKNLNAHEVFDENETPQENHYCEQEDLELTTFEDGVHKNGNTRVQVPVVFIQNEKNPNAQEVFDEKEEPSQEDHYSDDEDLELTTFEDGVRRSPAEIKTKIKKCLLEFRCRIEDAILGNYLLGDPNKKKHEPPEVAVFAREKLREITLWGVPLLPSKAHEGTDIVLMKFLKAKNYKVNDAFDMLQKTILWRMENNIDAIIDEDLDPEFKNAGFLTGKDREGRPVCYHVCSVFKDKVLYKKILGTQEKREKLLRWRIQLMERAIKKLIFREGGVNSILQIYDFKSITSQGMKEFNLVNKKAGILYQNYYPEIVHKYIVVYAPFWFYTSQVLFSGFMNQMNKKKFILARPQKVSQTLLMFIEPQYLPAEYGGLWRFNDQDFSPADKVLEHKIKGNSIARVEFRVSEPGVTVMWDVTVVGWEVSYKEEFIPDDEGSYTVLLQNQKREGDSTRNSFYINEPGRIVITVENVTYKKKIMFYRSKYMTTVPMFFLYPQ